MNVGLDDPQNEGMRIMAISDLNNDKLNDLVTVNADANQVTAWYFSDAALRYTSPSMFTLPTGFKADSIIVTKSQTML